MTADTIAAPEAARWFLGALERDGWRFSLNPKGELFVIVGDDHPPRWPQSKIFYVLDALAPAIIAYLAERDGLAGLAGGEAIH
jgi:hypothetical protein